MTLQLFDGEMREYACFLQGRCGISLAGGTKEFFTLLSDVVSRVDALEEATVLADDARVVGNFGKKWYVDLWKKMKTSCISSPGEGPITVELVKQEVYEMVQKMLGKIKFTVQEITTVMDGVFSSDFRDSMEIRMKGNRMLITIGKRDEVESTITEIEWQVEKLKPDEDALRHAVTAFSELISMNEAGIPGFAFRFGKEKMEPNMIEKASTLFERIESIRSSLEYGWMRAKFFKMSPPLVLKAGKAVAILKEKGSMTASMLRLKSGCSVDEIKELVEIDEDGVTVRLKR